MFDSLTIKNFRCFRDLAIDSLERVNLLIGMNDACKTALLEAIYFLLGETNLTLVVNTNAFRGLNKMQGDVHAISEWVCTPLFRNFDTGECIEIEGKWNAGTERKKRASFEREHGATRPVCGSALGPARTTNGLDARSFCALSNYEIRNVT